MVASQLAAIRACLLQVLRCLCVCVMCRGTLPYMAPELVSDPERVSEKADVWSLGMVLWEMLTRQVPFTHLTPQQIIAGLMVGNLQPEVCPPSLPKAPQNHCLFAVAVCWAAAV